MCKTPAGKFQAVVTVGASGETCVYGLGMFYSQPDFIQKEVFPRAQYAMPMC